MLYPETVATILLQGPPLDFHAEGGFFDFGELVRSCNPATLADAFGTFPAPVLDAGLAIRKPIEYTVGAPLRLAWNFVDEQFVENFARRAGWVIGGMDVPGETYRGIVERLSRGDRTDRERAVRKRQAGGSRRHRRARFAVVGTDGAFAPPGMYEPFPNRASSDDTATIEVLTTHVGLSVAPEAHEVGWPRVSDWLEART